MAGVRDRGPHRRSRHYVEQPDPVGLGEGIREVRIDCDFIKNNQSDLVGNKQQSATESP